MVPDPVLVAEIPLTAPLTAPVKTDVLVVAAKPLTNTPSSPLPVTVPVAVTLVAPPLPRLTAFMP
jgi:hypothetical protein